MLDSIFREVGFGVAGGEECGVCVITIDGYKGGGANLFPFILLK